MATTAGRGAGPLGGFRAARRDFGGSGAVTRALDRTASGDVQPSAWLAACVAGEMRSGAGVILGAAAPARAGVGCGGAANGFAARAGESAGVAGSSGVVVLTG